MSVFNDFQQVWLQRFPDNPLPGAWEEHVKLNLAKHRQKVSMFKEEVRKEEIYVEYLERLLLDIQKHKKQESGEEGESSKSDVTADNVSNSATNLSLEEFETFSANMCVTEISNVLSKLNSEQSEDVDLSMPDPSSFVTVIEVNGLKPSASTQTPPKIPVKPDFSRNNSLQEKIEPEERVSTPEEPYYDVVAPEDQDFNLPESDNSSAENTLSSQASFMPKKGSQSPSASNYVNIEYFIQASNQNDNEHSSSDEEGTEMRHRGSNGSYASSSSLDSSTPHSRRKFQPEDLETATENSRYKCILKNIISSEEEYVEWLSVSMKYMKALQATLTTSQRIITETELNTIFYKIPELYGVHSSFLEVLKNHVEKNDNSGKTGECFKNLALNLELYGAFLSNYGRALDTVRKCCETNSLFRDVTKNITCKYLSKQPNNLEEILHKPVARVQKNALVLHDLLNSLQGTHPDYASLSEALQLTQGFLDQFNMIQTKSMFPVSDRAQRRLVKNSFIVEFADGHRKLRHLFLFNDVIACAKYKPSGRTEKYTFELKWFIPVEDIIIFRETSPQHHHESTVPNIVSLKSQASNVRDQLRQEEKALEDKKTRSTRGSDKFKKRLVELESQLVLVSPNLPFRIKNRQTGRLYTFFLSSEFERTQWVEAILTLQKTGKPPVPSPSFSMLELQTWITACRAFLKTNMGSYLLRSVHDESLLVGDLHVHIFELTGLEYSCELYVVFEVDFYGHFFQKAKTKAVQSSNVFTWGEKFVIDLEGCENLRILVYRTSTSTIKEDTLVGKYTQKLSRSWLRTEPVEKKFNINVATLRLNLTYIPCVVSLRRLPTGKNGALFGEKIQVVCKRQKRDIPFIITACIKEVERRGMTEVGLYRVSGSASDISKLKKSFETNSYEAEQLLKEVDIHSVTGILKLYLRELPEALFTDQLYPALSEAFNQSNGNYTRRIELLKGCFAKLPQQNKIIIKFILDHLIRVHKHEEDNKMSLHNLATVFGPTLLRPGFKASQNKPKDTLSAETVDVMAQAGILYCYLQDLDSNKNNC
ncbi:active breakpoint cluster region-related protein [Tribolium castaneum]|uniref:Breakpoint cluster region protein-like Protein n=1 Tax=Tribolium castaneum TaxID=7070 RepID=D6WH91_TRICA|nr:PREDICTED: active breakpoint cluster region-related protein [Tribolium castaneum]EFA00987.1 Breakpoint cluster region protein-like Protein [Tribolium castaneum]|eukprot:XP_970436.2 PREDICTED: active breakpoint cluster region-related protein [Tribolium castaneum]